MEIRLNLYGLKLFFLSIVIFSFMFILSNTNQSIDTLSGIIEIALFDITIAIISLLFIEDLDPKGYYLSWFWAVLAFLLLSRIITSSSIKTPHLGIVYTALIPVVFSFTLGTLFAVVRYIAGKLVFKKSLETTIYSEYRMKVGSQNIRMSFGYGVLVILDIFYFTKGEYFFLNSLIFSGLLMAAFIVSFFAIYLTDHIAFNLSVFFIFLISILPILEYNQAGYSSSFFLLILILIISSVLIYLLLFKEDIDPKTGEYTGAVVSTRRSEIIGTISLLGVWAAASTALHTLSVNLETVLFILFPIAVGSVTSDILHGMSADKEFFKTHSSEDFVSGAVGGVGMGDGLWFSILFLISVYLIIFRLLH